MQFKKTIILAAGGTGGHLFTALALAENLTDEGNDIHLITDSRCEKYLKNNEPATVHIFKLHLKMSGIVNKFCSIFQLINICFKTLYLIWKLKPSLVVGFGGYSSFPALLAARILRIPYIIHEQNCFLGKTNRVFASSAKVIALSYRETRNIQIYPKEKIVFTGDVVRSSIMNLPVKRKFNEEEFRLFIFGGSQGAKIFSTLIPECMEELIRLDPQLKIHLTQQVSDDYKNQLTDTYNKLGIKYSLSPFFHNMAEIYAKADLVISRGGAGTIAELTYAGIPAIFVPFPHSADDHQYHNAKALEDSSAGWCYRQNELTPSILAQKIWELSQRRELLELCSRNIIARRSNGAKILADTVLKK